MAEEKEQQIPEPQKEPGRLKMIGGAECPVFYVNVGAAISTPFDIQLLLGEIVEADEGHVTGQSRVRIVMAPEHALLLAQALAGRIHEYGQSYGNLRSLPIRTGASGHGLPSDLIGGLDKS
jgi:hypothetical protein